MRGERKNRPLGIGVEKRREKTDRDREEDMGGGQSSFKREHDECVQGVLLVATAEDVYPKVRPVQMPEY